MHRFLLLFPKAADPAEVDALIQDIASSFKGRAGSQAITRSAGSLMGPGAMTGDAGSILEADFATLEDALAAIGSEEFHDVKTATEALGSTIFLFELGEA